MSIVRLSKYRHVFGKPDKHQNCFLELRPNVSAWDSDYLKSSGKFFAFPWQGGGGSIAVLEHGKGGKQKDVPLLSDHSGRIMDLDFSPFNDHVVATVAMDVLPKVWSIPKDGLKKTITKAPMELEGHSKRVGMTKFHPTAENILATASADKTLKFWDVKKGKEALSFDTPVPQSITWNLNGSTMAYSSKDKKLRLFDPRGNKTLATVKGHAGTKGFRVRWLKKLDKIFTVGSSKMAERHYMLFDPRKLEEPLLDEPIDSSSGIIMPFFDEDTSILYLAGKGDGNIRYYEIENKDPYIHFIENYRSQSPQKGMGMVPKYALDTSSCEVTRLLKLEKNGVTPIHFCVPRKLKHFQKDIYPDTYSYEAAVGGPEWLKGKDANPKVISMDPKKNPYAKVEFKQTKFAEKLKKKESKLPQQVSSPKQLKEQNEEFRKKIKALEEEVYQLQKKVKDLEDELAEKKADEKKEEKKVEKKEEDPQVEEPKEEEPQVEEPKEEEPQVEEPQVEEPQVEEPKEEEPKEKEPQAEEPKDEEPKDEEPKDNEEVN